MSVPHLVLDVHEDGTLTATLDHHPVVAPEDVGAWRRAMFAQIIDHVTHDRATPVRITVHEVDGSTFTDILPAAKRPASKPATGPEPEPVKRPGRRRRGADPVEVDGGDGFISGEDVAVAVIVAHTDATPDGRARALLDPTVVGKSTGEVVLVGRVSGTIAVRGLP